MKQWIQFVNSHDYTTRNKICDKAKNGAGNRYEELVFFWGFSSPPAPAPAPAPAPVSMGAGFNWPSKGNVLR
jgi:hypothetical protein